MTLSRWRGHPSNNPRKGLGSRADRGIAGSRFMAPVSSPSPCEDNAVWSAERLLQASYKDLGSPSDVESRFYRHLMENDITRKSLQELLQATSTNTRDYSMTVDMFDLLQSDPILGQLLLRFPATLLPILEQAMVAAQKTILPQLQSEQTQNNASTTKIKTKFSVKGDKEASTMTRVHARLVNLPPTCQSSIATALSHQNQTSSNHSTSQNYTMHDNMTSAQGVGKIVQISGTVVRVSPVQMYESARTYQCKACGKSFVVHADLEQRANLLQPPTTCPLPINNNSNAICNQKNLQHVASVHTDYQELKIQLDSEHTSTNVPQSLLVKLQHDLVDPCQPGDSVVVVGSLLSQWHTAIPDMECHVGMALDAHSIRVVATDDDTKLNNIGEIETYKKEFQLFWQQHAKKPIQGRDYICQAVCPKLYGLAVIKLALLVTLVGGVAVATESHSADTLPLPTNHDGRTDQPDAFELVADENEEPSHAAIFEGAQNRAASRKRQKTAAVQTRRRDQSHLLLVGDPGTGKSQILRFAAALSPRSVLTTGVGTTSAGLTCAAVREGSGKEFALEAGALVLADKGVCCIDEFGCIQESDRTTIHEAMEQQTLSVAKAGIVCKLNCRATIIAVMNPRGCLYDNQASLSVNTGLGTPLLSRFDLIFKLVDSSDCERDANVTTYLLNRAIQGAGLDVAYTNEQQRKLEPWSMEKLRAYIAVVRDLFHPIMGDVAAVLLTRHYEKCRSSRSNTIPVTVRFLESLIRLSQAHARIMYRDRVTLQDAVAVIRLMECSAFAYGGFDGQVDDCENIMYCDPMTIDFSDQADLDFLCFEYRVLCRYDMVHHMSDDRRSYAEEVFGKHNAAASTSWVNHELGSFAPGFQPGPTNSHANARGFRGISHEDHYGRFHFSSQPPSF